MQLSLEPCFVCRAMLGLRDTVSELTEHDHWDGRLRLMPQYLADANIAIDKGAQRIRIEDHARSSGSIISNSSSIVL